jgi:hypothetical protein
MSIRQNINAGRVARDVPMIVSLALTLAVGGQGVAGDLPLDGGTATALGMGGALLFDSLWLAGSVALPDALVVRGGKLALSVSAMVAGIAASIWSLAHYGHGPLFLAPVFAVLLTVGIELNKHVTPSAETIADLRLQDAAARDLKARSRAAERLSKSQRTRASLDRDIVAEKLTDELLDADRADAARTMALLAAQAKLSKALDKSNEKHGEGAQRFLELRGTTKAPELPSAAPEADQAPSVPATAVAPVQTAPVASTEDRFPSAQVLAATSFLDASEIRPAVTEPLHKAYVNDDSHAWIAGVLAEAEQIVATDPSMRLLTTAEVAALAGKSEGTVRSWSSRKNVAGQVKLPVADRDEAGKSLYRYDDVMALLG